MPATLTSPAEVIMRGLRNQLLGHRQLLSKSDYAELLAQVGSFATEELGRLTEGQRPFYPMWKGDDGTPPSW